MQVNDVSDHARIRMQQRGIPPAVLDCLLTYGHSEYDHQGACIVYFDKASRARLSRTGVQLAKIEKYLKTYAVVACDGTIKTVGHRYKRIPRN
jgi:hypothetical protein